MSSLLKRTNEDDSDDSVPKKPKYETLTLNNTTPFALFPTFEEAKQENCGVILPGTYFHYHFPIGRVIEFRHPQFPNGVWAHTVTEGAEEGKATGVCMLNEELPTGSNIKYKNDNDWRRLASYVDRSEEHRLELMESKANDIKRIYAECSLWDVVEKDGPAPIDLDVEENEPYRLWFFHPDYDDKPSDRRDWECLIRDYNENSRRVIMVNRSPYDVVWSNGDHCGLLLSGEGVDSPHCEHGSLKFHHPDIGHSNQGNLHCLVGKEIHPVYTIQAQRIPLRENPWALFPTQSVVLIKNNLEFDVYLHWNTIETFRASRIAFGLAQNRRYCYGKLKPGKDRLMYTRVGHTLTISQRKDFDDMNDEFRQDFLIGTKYLVVKLLPTGTVFSPDVATAFGDSCLASGPIVPADAYNTNHTNLTPIVPLDASRMKLAPVDLGTIDGNTAPAARLATVDEEDGLGNDDNDFAVNFDEEDDFVNSLGNHEPNCGDENTNPTATARKNVDPALATHKAAVDNQKPVLMPNDNDANDDGEVEEPVTRMTRSKTFLIREAAAEANADVELEADGVSEADSKAPPLTKAEILQDREERRNDRSAGADLLTKKEGEDMGIYNVKNNTFSMGTCVPDSATCIENELKPKLKPQPAKVFRKAMGNGKWVEPKEWIPVLEKQGYTVEHLKGDQSRCLRNLLRKAHRDDGCYMVILRRRGNHSLRHVVTWLAKKGVLVDNTPGNYPLKLDAKDVKTLNLWGSVKKKKVANKKAQDLLEKLLGQKLKNAKGFYVENIYKVGL